MKSILDIDFTDFYFNGHYLSQFGGFIGGTERLSKYPLLPSRNYTTDRAIGQDGETVFDSYLEPRQFEVPIFFDKLDNIGIRKIAGWLNTKTDQWFFYKGDALKIKCTLDSNGTFLDQLGNSSNRIDNGFISLKFIAHDPYFYEITPTIYDYQSLTSTLNRFSFTNLGNEESLPFLSIWGNGTISIKVYSESLSNLLTSCTVTDLITGVELNTRYRTCTAQSGAPLFHKFSGKYPILPTGNYIIEIIGPVSRIKIDPNYRYI